jgi:glyoxylase-like metal-dependent hydrolase (beta-lactamase superfamily II)
LIITEATKITENIYLLDTVWSTYLVVGEELALVEAGVSTCVPTYIENIKKFGFKPEDISYIVVPHAHSDHRSGFALLLNYMPRAKIFAHALGVKPLKHPEIPEPRREFARNWQTRPVEVSKTLKDGDIMDLGAGVKFKVLETPGHSDDSFCLYDEKNMALFVSDAAGAYIPWTNDWVPNPFYDLGLYYKSIERLKKLPVKTLAPGHNGVATGPDAKKAIENSLKTAKRWETKILEEVAKGPKGPDQLASIFLKRFENGLKKASSELRTIGSLYPYRYVIYMAISAYLRGMESQRKIEKAFPDLPYFKARP